LGGGPPEFPQDFSCPVVLGNPAQGVPRIYPTGLSPAVVRLSRRFGYAWDFLLPAPTAIGTGQAPRPQRHNACGLSRDVGLSCSLFARRYWGNRGCFLFLRVLRCFSSPRSPPAPMDSEQDLPGFSREGLPHLGILGLASVCDYPRLIAAYHALHRLLVPRHPPYTLSSLTPLRFGETEWIPDRYSVVKERIPLEAEHRLSARHPRETRGGDERNRTADPLLAKQVLSRLSYIPTTKCRMANVECGMKIRIPQSAFRNSLVGLPGIEPGTSRLSSVRSSRLS
jgi:hypothetical protein